MDDFYSREITLADMPFLMHEFEEGARLGHFTNEIITPVGSSILAVEQIQQQKFTVCCLPKSSRHSNTKIEYCTFQFQISLFT